LPVKGSPQHPARAKLIWHTPATPGHYCLLVRLNWPDDANPKNNIGQENTNVGVAASPAHFDFPVRNDDTIRKVVQMVADAYTIPAKLRCDKVPTKQDSERRFPGASKRNVFVPPSEKDADWALARTRHALDGFPIPAGWSVEIEPRELDLAPGDIRNVHVSITPPDEFRGERPFNINALYGAKLLGGVTLTVTR
jgi:hypothetical protein